MTRQREWAPWWVYAAVAVGLNLIRHAVLPPSEVGTFWTITLFLAVLAVTAAVVPLGHRLVRGRA